MSKNTLDGLLNVSSFNKKYIQNFNGENATIFEVMASDIFLSKPYYAQQYQSIFGQFFNTIDEHSKVSFLYDQHSVETHSTESSYSNDAKSIIREDYLSHLESLGKSENIRERHTYVVVYDTDGSFTQKIEVLFSQLDIQLRMLSKQETFSLVWKHLNPGKPSEEMPDIQRLESNTELNPLLMQSAMMEHTQYVETGTQFCKSISMHLLPFKEIDFHFLDLLLNKFKTPYKIRISIEKKDQEQIQKRLTSISGFLPNFGQSSIKNTRSSQNISQDLDSAIAGLSHDEEHCLSIKITICFYHTGKDSLNALVSNAISDLKQYKSTQFISEDFDQQNAYLSILPHHEHLNTREHGVLGKNIGFFIPAVGPFKGEKKGDFLIRTSDNDLFPYSVINNSLPAPHALILGETGAGKSFFINYILKNTIAFYENKLNILIIDFGGSYEKLCKVFGGTYYRVKCSSDYPLTIFPRKKSIMDESSISADQLKILSQLILLLSGLSSELTIGNNETHLINKYIIQLYRNKSETFLPKLEDFFKLINDANIGDVDDAIFIKKLAKSLHLFVDKDLPYYGIFNSEKELDLSNPFIVFDLTEIETIKEISGVVLHIISNLGRLRMLNAEKSGIRQIIARDECWKALAEGSSVSHGQVIEEEYRTARKYGTTLLSISNSIKDFLSGVVGNIIREMSYTKYILPNDAKKEDLKAYGLNDNEVRQCQNLRKVKGKYNHIFVKYDKERFIIHLEPSALEKELCSKDLNNTLKTGDIELLSPTELIEQLQCSAKNND